MSHFIISNNTHIETHIETPHTVSRFAQKIRLDTTLTTRGALTDSQRCAFTHYCALWHYFVPFDKIILNKLGIWALFDILIIWLVSSVDRSFTFFSQTLILIHTAYTFSLDLPDHFTFFQSKEFCTNKWMQMKQELSNQSKVRF